MYYYISPQDHWVAQFFVGKGVWVGSTHPGKIDYWRAQAGGSDQELRWCDPGLFEGIHLNSYWN
jgi:hypothetical protein